MLRRMIIALVTIGIVLTGTTAQAKTGWARYPGSDGYVQYHVAKCMAGENPRLIARCTKLEAHAIRRAIARHREYLKAAAQKRADTLALLAAGQASIDLAQATIGFPASCVADAEEGGDNSWAGYFGFISPPASYGGVAAQLDDTYGQSWLNWPYSAQLQVAIDLYRRIGGSAWGPRTRAKCGI